MEANGYAIVESSPKLKERTESGRPGYPFKQTPVGHSFTVPIEGTNEQSLRCAAYNARRNCYKIFKVIKHKDHGIFEVGCIGEI